MNKSQKTGNVFLIIPNEVFVEIFLFLDKKSILELYRVNKRINEILYSDIFNQLLCKSLWPSYYDLPNYIFEKFHNNSKRNQFLTGNRFRFTSYAITFSAHLDDPTKVRKMKGKYFWSKLPGSKIRNRIYLPDMEKVILDFVKFGMESNPRKDEIGKMTLEEAMGKSTRNIPENAKDEEKETPSDSDGDNDEDEEDLGKAHIPTFPYVCYTRYDSVSLEGEFESKYPSFHHLITHLDHDHEYECTFDENFKPVYGLFMRNEFDPEWGDIQIRDKYGWCLVKMINIFSQLDYNFQDNDDLEISYCKPLYSYALEQKCLDLMKKDYIIDGNTFKDFMDAFKEK